METTIFRDGLSRAEVEDTLKNYDPEEIVVRNGRSWKCPVYVQRLPPCRNKCPASEDIRGYLTDDCPGRSVQSDGRGRAGPGLGNTHGQESTASRARQNLPTSLRVGLQPQDKGRRRRRHQ